MIALGILNINFVIRSRRNFPPHFRDLYSIKKFTCKQNTNTKKKNKKNNNYTAPNETLALCHQLTRRSAHVVRWSRAEGLMWRAFFSKQMPLLVFFCLLSLGCFVRKTKLNMTPWQRDAGSTQRHERGMRRAHLFFSFRAVTDCNIQQHHRKCDATAAHKTEHARAPLTRGQCWTLGRCTGAWSRSGACFLRPCGNSQNGFTYFNSGSSR